MKVYILTISQLEKTPDTIVSSFRTPRHPRTVEYYASREGAEKRVSEIYHGLKSLVGFIDGVETDIQERELKP